MDVSIKSLLLLLLLLLQKMSILGHERIIVCASKFVSRSGWFWWIRRDDGWSIRALHSTRLLLQFIVARMMMVTLQPDRVL